MYDSQADLSLLTADDAQWLDAFNGWLPDNMAAVSNGDIVDGMVAGLADDFNHVVAQGPAIGIIPITAS